jgi:hypothetical protein
VHDFSTGKKQPAGGGVDHSLHELSLH